MPKSDNGEPGPKDIGGLKRKYDKIKWILIRDDAEKMLQVVVNR